MLIISYIGYFILVFILGTVIGTYVSALKGKANSNFASPGFIMVMGLIIGLPCYFIGVYLRENGNEIVSLIILLISVGLGILIGLNNRA